MSKPYRIATPRNNLEGLTFLYLYCFAACKQVCDSGCGTPPYGSPCNWSNLGMKCPFCFHQATTALIAGKITHEARGRLILCDINETFPGEPSMARIADVTPRFQNDGVVGKVNSTPADGTHMGEPPSIKPAEAPFIGDIMHGNICHFIPGYFEFFHEARLAVASILTFMPGVRVVIATHPMDYHVFDRSVQSMYRI